MTTQYCSACGLKKSLDEFHYRKDRGTYRSQCKSCYANRPSAAGKRAGQKAKVTQVMQTYVLVDRKRKVVESIVAPVLSSKPLADVKQLDKVVDLYRDMGCIVVEIGDNTP